MASPNWCSMPQVRSTSDTATVASLGHALDVLEKQSDLKGLLLRSEKAAFIVGADITEFLSLFWSLRSS